MAEGLEVATTAASLEQRSDLLWRWGNAWALAGHELPVRLPLVVQNVSQTAAPGRAATPALFREIDSYLASSQADGFVSIRSDRAVQARLPCLELPQLRHQALVAIESGQRFPPHRGISQIGDEKARSFGWPSSIQPLITCTR